jgi:hypothetical protein
MAPGRRRRRTARPQFVTGIPPTFVDPGRLPPVEFRPGSVGCRHRGGFTGCSVPPWIPEARAAGSAGPGPRTARLTGSRPMPQFRAAAPALSPPDAAVRPHAMTDDRGGSSERTCRHPQPGRSRDRAGVARRAPSTAPAAPPAAPPAAVRAARRGAAVRRSPAARRGATVRPSLAVRRSAAVRRAGRGSRRPRRPPRACPGEGHPGQPQSAGTGRCRVRTPRRSSPGHSGMPGAARPGPRRRAFESGCPSRCGGYRGGRPLDPGGSRRRVPMNSAQHTGTRLIGGAGEVRFRHCERSPEYPGDRVRRGPAGPPAAGRARDIAS